MPFACAWLRVFVVRSASPLMIEFAVGCVLALVIGALGGFICALMGGWRP